MKFKSLTNWKDSEKLTLHQARWIICWKVCVHCRCLRIDLVRMMGFNHFQPKQRLESGRSNFSPFRLLLFEISEEMDTTDLKMTLFNMSAVIPRSEHDKIKSICDVFIQLQRSGDLYPANIEVLYKLLKMMDRGVLIKKVRTYQGAQLKGGNIELENRPVDEGHVTIATESTEPVYLGEGQIPPTNAVEQQRPTQASERSVQIIGNRLPLHLGQFQTSTASANPSVIPSQRESIDIQGQIHEQSRNKNSRTDHNMDDYTCYMRKKIKMQDKKTDKNIPSHQENPVFLGSQQEQPSPGTNQFERCVVNQTLTEPLTSHRTEIQSEVTVNPLVPRNNIKADKFPGDSGLTVGTVLFSDRSLKDISLLITESQLVELSEVIARRDDCMLLASALMIDYGRISQIMLANPTNVLRVHGFLKHWFIEQRNRLGTSPSADGLLKAFQLLGFTDAIDEYVRLSREPESEFQQDIPLLITESQLVELSEVIARRDDCMLLASALMIDYGRISQIMLANPTNVLRVHGFLKHWFIEQRNRLGTSPSADGLLKAFQLLGFTDAIDEYVRLSREPESEFQQDIPLLITESQLVELSEVIARRDDCMLLASALMIDYGRISQIMLANPTNVLRVHGFLKHWFIEQRNRLGTSPSADGLLKAFQLLGFTDAIDEYVRLSREPESEFQQDIPLLITESQLVELSKVIARRDDCILLASALMIDYGRISQIMLANPTNVLRVHGFLKHWFIEQKNRLGTSPSTDGLLKAFQLLGFTDAIEEYVRLSQEPESEFEQGLKNLAARPERSGNQEENINVSSGEARVSQGNAYTYFRAATPPTHQLNSGAQVASSLNPHTNQNIRQPNRQDDFNVQQMEAVVIDDSAMPFYKMNARPRGLAIIINNQHFHKIRNDKSSKKLPERTGTEKDAEKLDYIWRKLDFEVHLHNDVDSSGMCIIMVEKAFQDHSKYDCLVVSILTHGVLGHVYGADGKMVRIGQLTTCFSSRRCPSLAGKPKLFFIQACQGREKQEGGHAVETDGKGFKPIPDSSEERQYLNVDRPRELIPDEADFLLGYATSPGYVSYRSRSQGSWYINKLTMNLDKYAYQHDLLSILIKVNEEVGRATANIDNGVYKQIPAPMFTLRKRIIFR